MSDIPTFLYVCVCILMTAVTIMIVGLATWWVLRGISEIEWRIAIMKEERLMRKKKQQRMASELQHEDKDPDSDILPTE
jgi:uncharacterized membrane protein YciS (DUF1049 family)